MFTDAVIETQKGSISEGQSWSSDVRFSDLEALSQQNVSTASHGSSLLGLRIWSVSVCLMCSGHSPGPQCAPSTGGAFLEGRTGESSGGFSQIWCRSGVAGLTSTLDGTQRGDTRLQKRTRSPGDLGLPWLGKTPPQRRGDRK